MTRFLRYVLAVAALAGAVSPALAAADEPDGEVTGVSLISSPGRAEVVVTIRGEVEINDFVLHSPERLVLDVQGAVLRSGVQTLYDGVNRGGVRNIRYNQFRPDVVRIVLEFDQLKDYEIARVKDEIRVSFGSERAFLAWSATAPAELVPPSSTKAASRRPSVELPEERTLATAPVQSQQPRITVTWFKASIGDVVAGFAAFSGRTIIMGKDVDGEVTAEIKNQPWDQAFEAILATQGLSAQEMPGGIIRVDSPAALAALDSLEPLQTQLVRVNYAKASSLAKSIEGILTKDRGSVVPDTGSNTLIITDTRSRLGGIADFVSQLDIRTPQIAIQAKIIFVDRSDLQQLGVQYDLGDNDVFFNKLVQRFDPSTGEPFDPNTVVIGGSSVAAISNADASIPSSALDLVWRTTVGGFSLTTFLTALERIELADVQAEPVISTLDNREADILVGEETPIRVIDVSSATGAGVPPRASVQLKETGIRLTVTPHVTNNRQILMELLTERSAVQALAAADLGFNFPKQSARNQLLVNDGETAVIGGLTITEITRTRSGIPLLSGLPLVGNLFSFSSDQERRRDLIILVTPRIIDDGGLQSAP